MTDGFRTAARGAFLLVLLIVAASAYEAPAHAAPAHSFRALVFSKTAGFRHDSIGEGVAAIQALASVHDFEVDATEDAAVFNDIDLAGYDVVVFLNTTGDVLGSAQQAAFERFIRRGGGFVGIHAAADTEYDWPFYGDLVGAYFDSHPATQQGTVTVVDRQHLSTAGLPERWARTDEWYNFRTNPRGTVHVLATLDEGSYGGGTMGADHPIAWCHAHEGGRAWYTAGGHTRESYAEPLFREHLLQGIEWAAGGAPGDCSGTVWDNFEVTVLDDATQNPIYLDVAADGRVFFAELGGAVKIYHPETALTTVAARLDVFVGNEHGLLGLALDPAFLDNGWLYLFYTPAQGSVDRVARFSVVGDALDLASEVVLLEIPVVRSECCHAGGALGFDAAGDLFIATGDDTNPFDSGGYAPLDERPDRAAWDAQRTAANTMDLRGKILRITPQPNGSYTLPPGNLFPPGSRTGREEIYVMGVRNPFRFSIDPLTGWLYWGDVGPDATSSSPARGPAGLDEWNQARAAGNFGWPYCLGPNVPFVDFDFATGTSGAAFDCAAPTNTSPSNTGSMLLPPAQPAWIWYPYGPSEVFPGLADGPGRTAMAGPVYAFDDGLDAPGKFPVYYDRTLFIYEWARSWIHEVKLDAEGGVLAIQPFLPDEAWRRPIAMAAGPDGALYLIEWGTGFGGGNDDARLVRVAFQQGTRAPVAVLDATPTSGPLPLTVQFSAENSFDPDAGDLLSFAWDFKADGTPDAEGVTASHTYTEAGVFTAQLVVRDPAGLEAVANVQISAGNTRPTVTLAAPFDGGFFDWGDVVRFETAAADAEDGTTADGTVDCDRLVLQPLLGHDDHAHPLDVFNGCEGTFQTAEGHGGDADNLFYVVEARFTDAGGLTARAQHILRPKRLQAEHFTTNAGTIPGATGDVGGGGENLGFIAHGDYVSFAPVNLHSIGFATFRVASAGLGGRIEIHADAPEGPLLGTAYVEPTGDWNVYREVTTPLDDPGGTRTLFLVFLRNPGDDGLFNLNWIDFHGPGVAENYTPRGLTATYFSNADFTGRSVERIDPQINFNWAFDGPLPLFDGDTFSVRWEGQVEAAASGAHTFFARSSDGIRLWLDGQLIIDRWVNRAVAETPSLPVRLVAGQRYDLRVEYFDNVAEAQAHLSWSSPAVPKQIVPARQLSPTDARTSVTDAAPVSSRLLLDPVFPNPAAGPATLAFHLPQAGVVRLEVFDVLGRRMAVLEEAFREAGSHTVAWDARAFADGLYLCRLTTPHGTAARPVVIRR